MKLLLIRHGESEANAERRHQGTLDSPLSARGRAQVCALAQRLVDEGWPVSALYASDLRRAAATAEILGVALGIPVEPDARLREYDAGILNGMALAELQARFPELWYDLHHSREWVSIPGAEGNEPFQARIATAVDAILARHHEGEVVAVVSHGASLGMILSYLLGLDCRRPAPFAFENASLSVVEFYPTGPLLTRLGDAAHLAG